MISYRYHLVSVIAIFLAIALGVVVGTSALNGAVVGDLRRQVSDLKSSGSAASEQNRALQARAGNADLLAQTFGAKIVGAALAKVPVVLVGAPGATKAMKDTIAAEITAAGGTVAGRLQLSGDLVDPKRANDIRSLATSTAVHPDGLQLPTTGDAGTLAGALLGFVLFGHGQSTDLAQVLASFSTLNMLKAESGNPGAGKALVLVAPGSRPAGEAAATLQSFATEVALVGGPTVVAGDQQSDTGAGLVAELRGNDAAKKALSTVDDGTGSLGTLTVVLTVADALAGRKGNYGVAPGADALLPGVSS
ncbi:MAG TPA: copper transporter [Jatrophihabitans sp.]|nr:copper transporter [Jatrophihabitans sp.]